MRAIYCIGQSEKHNFSEFSELSESSEASEFSEKSEQSEKNIDKKQDFCQIIWHFSEKGVNLRPLIKTLLEATSLSKETSLPL